MNQEIDLSSAGANILGLNNAEICTCDIQGLAGEFPVMWIKAINYAQNFEIGLKIVFRVLRLLKYCTHWQRDTR